MKPVIAARLRELRKSKNLTQEEMSQILHVRRQTYANYEAGIRTPSLDSLILLAQHFHVTLDFLLCPECSSYVEPAASCLSSKKESSRLSSYERQILKDTQELTSAEQKQVMAFIRFIKQNKPL